MIYINEIVFYSSVLVIIDAAIKNIILLLGENRHSQGGKKKCQVCIILFGTY